MTQKRQYDLQERWIDYAVRIIKLSESLPDTKAGKHVSSQILRSGTSPAPNYGEAQSAESSADFVHKLKIALNPSYAVSLKNCQVLSISDQRSAPHQLSWVASIFGGG